MTHSLRLIVLLGLSSASFPAQGEFRRVPLGVEQSCPARLQSNLGIPYRCQRWADRTAKLPLWQDFLGFRFGRLRYSDWRYLMRIYGSWHNARLLSPYDARRSYELLDFMPPMIQALDKHRFYMQQTPIIQNNDAKTLAVAQLVTNCWGTVYEILRLAKASKAESPVLFATAADPMLSILRRVSTSPATSMQPGDILLISHRHRDREYLDHAAIAIDRGLFFEKAGTGDEVPYRFVEEATLRRIWNPAIFTYEIRRSSSEAALPQPQNIFSLKQHPNPNYLALWPRSLARNLTVLESADGSPPTFLRMQSMPSLRQVQERFQLPEEAYRRNGLRP
jgi:cell wall-associated NlpC family hydrolase